MIYLNIFAPYFTWKTNLLHGLKERDGRFSPSRAAFAPWGWVKERTLGMRLAPDVTYCGWCIRSEREGRWARSDWLSKLEGGYPVLFTFSSVNNIIVREAAALTSDSATSSNGLWFLWLHMLFVILIWDKSGVYLLFRIWRGVLIWRGALIRALTYCNCESYQDVDAAYSKCGIWASTTSTENSIFSCFVTIAMG